MCVYFFHIFRNFCLKFHHFCLYVKNLLTIVVIILFLKTKSIVDYFDLIFLAEILANYFKFQLFHQKLYKVSFPCPLY